MGNSGSGSSKRRTTDYDETPVASDVRLAPHQLPAEMNTPTQPPRRRRSSAGKRAEKKALLTTPEVPEALQRLIEDVNMDTMAMQLRQTSLNPPSVASTPTGALASPVGSPSGQSAMAAAAAFRHRSLSHRVDLEEAMSAQGISMAYVGGEQKLPTVFKWEGGGKEVYVSGSFNEWSAKIQMVRSTHNFYTIVDLPAGKHEYKFIVDGQWKTDSHQPVVNNDYGSTNNVIVVKPTDFQVFQALAEDVRQSEEDHRFRAGRRRTTSHSAEYASGRSGSPDGAYGQEVPAKSDFLWEIGSRDAPTPPLLPPQMLHVILNTDTSPHYDPNLLPEPNHVMLNHMYALSIKDGVMVLSLIQRFRKKFVTTVLYKPIDAAGIPKEKARATSQPPPPPPPDSSAHATAGAPGRGHAAGLGRGQSPDSYGSASLHSTTGSTCSSASCASYSSTSSSQPGHDGSAS